MKARGLTSIILTFFTLLNISIAQTYNPLLLPPNSGIRKPIYPKGGTIPRFDIHKQAHKQNQMIFDQNERDRLKRLKTRQMVQDDINEINSKTIQYDLPSLATNTGTGSYYSAYDTLMALMDRKDYDIMKATFTVENAFYDNELKYEDHQSAIDEIADFCFQKMKEDGVNTTSNTAKIMSLFRLFSDTIELNDKSKIHYPIEYDFEDFWGKKDLTKTFVTKLLQTNTGQCKNMPELFMNVAQVMGIDANLAFSPEHSYIKFKDDKGQWHNIELTNRKLTSDAFILGSGYIKSEAIQNKIYMHPMDKKETIAHMLWVLARNYQKQHGFDPFVLKCINKSLEYNPNHIFAILHKSDYITLNTQYVARQTGAKSLEDLQVNYPRAWAMYTDMLAIYQHTDNIGYEQMSKEAYQKWLGSLNNEIERKENERQEKELMNQIQVKIITD